MPVSTYEIRFRVNKLRQLDPHMSLTTVAFLLEVATAGELGMTGSTLANRLDLAHGSPRKYGDLLGDHGRGTKQGLGLITQIDDAEDRRLRLWVLTPKGKRFIDKLRG